MLQALKPRAAAAAATAAATAAAEGDIAWSWAASRREAEAASTAAAAAMHAASQLQTITKREEENAERINNKFLSVQTLRLLGCTRGLEVEIQQNKIKRKVRQQNNTTTLMNACMHALIH